MCGKTKATCCLVLMCSGYKSNILNFKQHWHTASVVSVPVHTKVIEVILMDAEVFPFITVLH